MLAWLIQQTIDLMSGTATGFTLGQLAVASALTMAVITAAYGCDYWSKPRFISRAIGQYKAFVLNG